MNINKNTFKQIAFAVLIAASLSDFGQSQNVLAKSPAHRKDCAIKTFNEADYKTVKKIADLPAGVRHALKDSPMSDAGGPFNAGCVVDPNKPAPMTRLIFAAYSKDKCILHFEQGGIAHFFKISCYELCDKTGREKDTASLLWSTILTGPSRMNGIANLADLNKLIKSGELQIDPAKN